MDDGSAPPAPPDRETLVLAQWFSPAYPVGGFAYSHGLETAIADGRIAGAGAAADWIGDVIVQGAGRGDAILLRLAHAAEDYCEVEGLNDAARALSASAERWCESRDQGAAFARTTAAIWGTDPARGAYPVVVGRAAARLGLPVDRTLGFYLQATASNLVSAAVRLVPLGQTEGQAILAGLAAPLERIVVETRGACLDDIASAAFAGDIAAMRHEALKTRIFRT